MNNIPAEFYKRAAEIMTSLPGVDFMTIVSVLYAHDTWEEKKNIPATLDNEELPTGLKWENPADMFNPTPHNMKREEIHATKKRPKILNIDGKVEAFCNARDLFKDYGIVKYYDVFAHLVQKCGRKKLIETEAKFLRDVFLKEFNANILSYTAWNFDGVKVKYDLEKETEENV